jgi:hypothetical protein
LEQAYSDRQKRRWILRWFWLISLGFLLFGFAVILMRLWQR